MRGVDDGATIEGAFLYPRKLLVGAPRHVDGYGVSWGMAISEMEASVLLSRCPEEHRELVRSRIGDRDPVLTPAPVIVIDFPDYPSDESHSYVMPVADAQAFADLTGR